MNQIPGINEIDVPGTEHGLSGKIAFRGTS